MGKSLLYARSYPVNDKISIRIPTVGEILEDEARYNSIVSCVISTPYDFMVYLDDMGIDFEELTEYDLFLLLFPSLQATDTGILFGDLDLSKFSPAINEENGQVVLLNLEDNIVIDRGVHDRICQAIRKINHLEKVIRRPGNSEAKKYMIERARIKLQRAARRKKPSSELENLIVALVNTEEFKYGYEDVLDLTIYQFRASADQIIRKIHFNNTMIGVFAGTVKAKELPQEDLTWIPINKK